MRPSETDFMLIVILGYTTLIIDGNNVSLQTIQIVGRTTDTVLVCPRPSSVQGDQELTWFSLLGDSSRKPVCNSSRFKVNTEDDSLLIHNVTIEDVGMYSCCIGGTCMGTILQVLDIKNAISFESHKDDASGKITVSSKGDFSITMYHGSYFNAEITKAPNITICTHSLFSGNAVCWIKRGTNSVTYHVRNANLQHSGQYVIHSFSNNIKGSYRLNILILGKPDLNLTCVQCKAGIKCICHGQAYPPPVFHMSYAPLDMNHTNAWSPIPIKHLNVSKNSANVSATAIITQPISGPGTVECRANNSEGEANAVPLFLDHLNVENHVTFSQISITEHDQLNLTVISPVESIHVGETMCLQCSAQFTTFTNRFVFEYNATAIDVYGMLEYDTWVANVTIEVTRDQLVACTAQFWNGTEVRKEIILPLK
uniref:Ig-like domain-containing protein n=1 Tax=Anopheles atroparvus TaxID=41427 RepID=A0AAG5D628_ANOAO